MLRTVRTLSVLLLCACETTNVGGDQTLQEDIAPDQTLRHWIFHPRPRDAAPDSALPDAAPPPPDAAPPDAAPPPARTHGRCGWIAPGDDVSNQTFIANASYFDVIHPAWYYISSDAVSISAIADAGNAQVLSAAQQNNIPVWPTVGGVGVVDTVRTMLNDSTKRSQNVQNLVNLAVSHGYAGLDIDYEGLWSASDRPTYQTFVQQLVQAMHAQGKKVSADIPALSQAVSYNAFDYAFLAANLDAVHIMGYDYHYLGGDHQGPVAPLAWVDAACAYAASTGSAAKFILGIPNYGIGPNFSCDGVGCDAACGGSYSTVDTHMASCPYGTFAAGRAPHCAYGGGTLYFDDLASQEEKVQAAHNHGLGGVTYWTIGREHAGWFDMVRRYY